MVPFPSRLLQLDLPWNRPGIFKKKAVLVTMVVTLKDAYHIATPFIRIHFLMGIMVVF